MSREKPKVLVYDEHDLWPHIEGPVSGEGVVSANTVTMPHNNKKYIIKRLLFQYECAKGHPLGPSPGCKPHLHPYLHVRIVNIDMVSSTKELKHQLDAWVNVLYGAEYILVLSHPLLLQRDGGAKEGKGGVVEALFSKKNPVDAARQRMQELEGRLKEKFKVFCCWGMKEAKELGPEIRKSVFSTFDNRLQSCFRNAAELKKDWDNNPKLCPYVAIIDEIGLVLSQFGLRDEASSTYQTLTAELNDLHHPNPVLSLAFQDRMISAMYTPDTQQLKGLFSSDGSKREEVVTLLRGGGASTVELDEMSVRVFIFVSLCMCWYPVRKDSIKRLKSKFDAWLKGLVVVMGKRGIPPPNLEATKFSMQIAFAGLVSSLAGKTRPHHSRGDSSIQDLELSGIGGKSSNGDLSPQFSQGNPASPTSNTNTRDFPALFVNEPEGASDIGMTNLNSTSQFTGFTTLGGGNGSSAQSLLGETVPSLDVTSRYEHSNLKQVAERTYIDIILEARVTFLRLGGYFNLFIPKAVSPDDVGEEIHTDPYELGFTVVDMGAPFNMEGLKGQREFEEHYIALTLHNQRFAKGHLIHGLHWEVAPALVTRGYLSIAYELIRSQAEYYAGLKWASLSVRARRLALVCLAAMKEEYSAAWISTALSVISEPLDVIPLDEKNVLWDSLKTRLTHIPRGHEFPLLSLISVVGVKVETTSRIVEVTFKLKLNIPAESTIENITVRLSDSRGKRHAYFEISEKNLRVQGEEEEVVEVKLVGEPTHPGEYAISVITVAVDGLYLRHSLLEEDQPYELSAEESALASITSDIVVSVENIEPLVELDLTRGAHHPHHIFDGENETATLTITVKGEIPLLPSDPSSPPDSPKVGRGYSIDDLSMSITMDSAMTAPQMSILPEGPSPQGAVGYLTLETCAGMLPEYYVEGPVGDVLEASITSVDGHTSVFSPLTFEAPSSPNVELQPLSDNSSIYAVVPSEGSNTPGSVWKISVKITPLLGGKKLKVKFAHTLPQILNEPPVAQAVAVLEVPYTYPFKVHCSAKPDESSVFVNTMLENQLPFDVEILSIDPVLPEPNRYKLVRNRGVGDGMTLKEKEGYCKAVVLGCKRDEICVIDGGMCECAMEVRYRALGGKHVNLFRTFPVKWVPPTPVKANVSVKISGKFSEPVSLTTTVSFSITITLTEDTPLHLWSLVVFPLDDWYIIGPCRKHLFLSPENPTTNFSVHMTPITTGNLGTPSVRLTSSSQGAASAFPDPEIPIKVVQSQARVLVA